MIKVKVDVEEDIKVKGEVEEGVEVELEVKVLMEQRPIKRIMNYDIMIKINSIDSEFKG